MKDALLHRLWTKAVDTDGYDKSEWRELELQLAAYKPRDERIKELEKVVTLARSAITRALQEFYVNRGHVIGSTEQRVYAILMTARVELQHRLPTLTNREDS